MFTTIGVGQWLRYVVGALEIAGAIGLLIPRLSGLAALLVGPTVTNLLILGDGPWLPLVQLLLSTLVVWGRWSQTKAHVSLFKR